METKYYNEEIDVTIVFEDDSFTIIGDETKVVEQDILDLHDDKEVNGWELILFCVDKTNQGE